MAAGAGIFSDVSIGLKTAAQIYTGGSIAIGTTAGATHIIQGNAGPLDYLAVGAGALGATGWIGGKLSGPAIENATEDTVTGYRAVSQAEWDHIQRTGEFWSPGWSSPTGNLGKWFYADQLSAEQLGARLSQLERTPYGVVQAQLPRNWITVIQHEIDASYGVTNGTGLFAEFPGLNGVHIRPIFPPH